MSLWLRSPGESGWFFISVRAAMFSKRGTVIARGV